MDNKLLDTVSIITALVLLPMVGVSAWAYVKGDLVFSAYTDMWREPLALLLGFWLRGAATKPP
jgi:hypothetical protein